MKTIADKVKKTVKFILDKLFRINDSPQRVALGVGVGVFCGIFPGTGPAAALFLAFCFRVNRAAALLGSLLTNTWLSIVTFILAIKTGSAILNIDWRQVKEATEASVKGFHFIALLNLSFIKVILPLFIGYLIIGALLGLCSYLLAIFIIRRLKDGDKKIHQDHP